MNLTKYEKHKIYFPDNYKEYVINGGNHSFFEDYGIQFGDGKASITEDEQQNYIVQMLLEN